MSVTRSPAVFRNARYAARLAFHEQRIAALEGLTCQLSHALDYAIKGLESFGRTRRERDELLPGEWKPEETRRPN